MWTGGPDSGCIPQTDHPRWQPPGTLKGVWEQTRLERERESSKGRAAAPPTRRRPGPAATEAAACGAAAWQGHPPRGGTVRAPGGHAAETWPNPTGCAADGPCLRPRTTGEKGTRTHTRPDVKDGRGAGLGRAGAVPKALASTTQSRGQGPSGRRAAAAALLFCRRSGSGNGERPRRQAHTRYLRPRENPQQGCGPARSPQTCSGKHAANARRCGGVETAVAGHLRRPRAHGTQRE